MLYRYLRHDFVETFRKEGVLRICPLKEYRTIRDVRQDDQEGMTTFSTDAVFEFMPEQANLVLGLDCHITQTGGNLIRRIELPHGFLISTSTACSPNLMRRFGSDDYITIFEPEAFGQAVKRAIGETCLVQYARGDFVRYVEDRVENYHTEGELIARKPIERSIDDFFVKERLAYEQESEFRFVFVVGAPNADAPVFIQLTKAEVRESCSFHAST